jgi:hypothetical protein
VNRQGRDAVDMNERHECSECNSHLTERVYTEWLSNCQVNEIRVCKDCSAQFINKFWMFEQETEASGV